MMRQPSTLLLLLAALTAHVGWATPTDHQAESRRGGGDDRGRPDRDDDRRPEDRRDGGRAVIELTHRAPREIEGWLGVVGERTRPIRVQFESERRGGRYDRNPRAVAEVDLRGYERYLNGRGTWYLKLTNRSRYDGEVTRFSILGDRGWMNARGVPAALERGRTLELRLTGSGSSSGSGSPSQQQIRVIRDLPVDVRPRERVRYTLVLDLRGERPERVEVTERVPPGWEILSGSHRQGRAERDSSEISFVLERPRDRQVIEIEVVAGTDLGRAYFSGSWTVDRGRSQQTTGDSSTRVERNAASLGAGRVR